MNSGAYRSLFRKRRMEGKGHNDGWKYLVDFREPMGITLWSGALISKKQFGLLNFIFDWEARLFYIIYIHSDRFYLIYTSLTATFKSPSFHSLGSPL